MRAATCSCTTGGTPRGACWRRHHAGRNRAESYCVEHRFFEVLTECLECLRWICRHFVQPFLVHETTKLRQCIFYNTEIFVLRIDVFLRVKTKVSRTHICSHIRYTQLLYLWTCIASGSGFEIIVQLVIATIFCFLARWLECGVRRNCSLLHGVRARWSRRLAL